MGVEETVEREIPIWKDVKQNYNQPYAFYLEFHDGKSITEVQKEWVGN